MKLSVKDFFRKCEYNPQKTTDLFTFPTTQKMKFSIKVFFSKCDQIRSFLRIWSHLLKKSLKENFIFCAVVLENKFRKEIILNTFDTKQKFFFYTTLQFQQKSYCDLLGTLTKTLRHCKVT